MLLTNLSPRAEITVSVLVMAAFIGICVTAAALNHTHGSQLVRTAGSTPEGGDVSWVLTASALVLLMTPGVAFFYGGMVKSTAVLSTMMLSFVTMGVITCLWIFIGFSLSFGSSVGGLFGNPGDFILHNNVGAEILSGGHPPIAASLLSGFHMKFAIITPALLTGSFVERVRFSGFIWFLVFWHILVYCPLAHMTWHPHGLLKKFGILDFAGGTVVHMSSGVAAMVGAAVLGARSEVDEHTNVVYVVLGTAILWFGWSGFNAGSAMGANTLAAHAAMTTNAGAASGMLAWLIMERIKGNKMRVTGVCCGVVVGLVAITPCAGYVSVGSALLVGILGSIAANCSTNLITRYAKVDDSLDSFSCHGVGGIVGMICTAIFSSLDINPDGANGLFQGGVRLFWHTLVSIPCLVLFIACGTFLCLKMADVIVTLRVPPEQEAMGMDVALLQETGQDSSLIFQRYQPAGSSQQDDSPFSGTGHSDRTMRMLLGRGVPISKLQRDNETGDVTYHSAQGGTFHFRMPGSAELTRQF